MESERVSLTHETTDTVPHMEQLDLLDRMGPVDGQVIGPKESLELDPMGPPELGPTAHGDNTPHNA